MSFTESTVSTPDAATEALWRAAETGNIDELVSVLPRVRDINARNEHGVTALMRAAQHGRLRAVRVLLEHGADANIIRNDKFTALALAAFFGHTEIVRALMERGADSQASTRHGTSPHMWATARTFNQVVDELESPAPPIEKPARVEKAAPLVERPAPVTPRLVEPVSRAVARAAAGSTVVRTLKDPPEIWDLVHPEPPKGFNARSAFMARLSSMRRGFAFRAVMVVALASVCAVGVWMLRGVQARSDVTAPSVTVSNPVAPSAPVESSAPTTAATTPSVNIEAPTTTGEAPTDKPVFTRRRSSRIRSAHGSEQTSNVAASDVSQPAALPVAKPSPQTRSGEQVTTSKNSAPLSPQLIAPVKSATPKAKVIQWP